MESLHLDKNRVAWIITDVITVYISEFLKSSNRSHSTNRFPLVDVKSRQELSGVFVHATYLA